MPRRDLNNPRSTRGYFDRLFADQANLRPGIYQRPQGTQQAVFKFPGLDDEIIASTGGLTFSAGQIVMLASNTTPGTTPNGYYILSPPAGSQGASSYPARFLPPNPSPVPPSDPYYALYMDSGGGIIRTWKYKSVMVGAEKQAIFDREVDILSVLPANFADQTIILTDGAGKVGPGSYVFSELAGGARVGVRVYDPTASHTYSRDPAGSARISSAAYFGGWVYWYEWPALSSGGGTVFTLYKARADFSGIVAVATHSFVATYSVDHWGGGETMSLSTTSASILADLDDGHGGPHVQHGLRISLDGGTVQVGVSGFLDGPSGVGIPEFGGGSVLSGAGGNYPLPLQLRPDSTSGAYADAWPNTGGFAFSAFADNASLSADLRTAALYGFSGDVPSGAKLVIASVATPGVSPQIVAVQNHPTILDVPTFMYLGS